MSVWSFIGRRGREGDDEKERNGQMVSHLYRCYVNNANFGISRVTASYPEEKRTVQKRQKEVQEL